MNADACRCDDFAFDGVAITCPIHYGRLDLAALRQVAEVWNDGCYITGNAYQHAFRPEVGVALLNMIDDLRVRVEAADTERLMSTVERVRALYERTMETTASGCSDDLEMFLYDLSVALGESKSDERHDDE